MKISKMLAASLFSLAACVSVNLAHAQDSGAAQPTSKKAARSANWKLEHAVRQAGLLSSPVCNRDRVIEVESISVDGS